MGLLRRTATGAMALAVVLGATACSDDGDEETFCNLITEHRDVLLGVDADPQQLERALEVYDQIVDEAPGEIRSEAEGLRELMREVRDADLSDASEFGRLIVRLTDESDEAEAFNAYVETHCGVSLRSTSVPTTTG